MSIFVKETFWVEIENQLRCFYKKDENVYLVKYKDYKVIEYINIIDECRELNSVILNKDGNISVIYTNLKDELILSNVLKDKVVKSIILLKGVIDYKHMQLAMINNLLNIFYINDIENISTLCFRVLNNKLVLTPPIIIDVIDTNREVPYVISANDRDLGVCYVKKASQISIGYRKFDFQRNSWSSFEVLDTLNYKIQDINFIIKENIIAFAYTFFRYKRGLITIGIGLRDNIRKNTIEEIQSGIYTHDMIISENDKLDVIYVVGNAIKIKELEINRELRTIDEISYTNIKEIKKYAFSSDRSSIKNTILIINADDRDIFTDSNFVEKTSIQKYQEVMGIPNILNKDVIISESELKEGIESTEISELCNDKNSIKPLIIKIKGYEEMINNLTQNFMRSDDEKKRLLENIDYLSEQLNTKDNKINRFERTLMEQQKLISSYESKVQDLTNILKNKDDKLVSKSELTKLQYIIRKNEEEKSSYENKVNGYKSNLQEHSLKIETLSKEIKILKDKISEFNNELSEKTKEVDKLVDEKNKLNDVVIESNTTLTRLTEEKNTLKNQIIALEEKNNGSFIKKLFKTGE